MPNKHKCLLLLLMVALRPSTLKDSPHIGPQPQALSRGLVAKPETEIQNQPVSFGKTMSPFRLVCFPFKRDSSGSQIWAENLEGTDGSTDPIPGRIGGLTHPIRAEDEKHQLQPIRELKGNILSKSHPEDDKVRRTGPSSGNAECPISPLIHNTWNFALPSSSRSYFDENMS